MKLHATYSHLNGLEWMKIHRPLLLDDIHDVIEELDASAYRNKISTEARMQGQKKFAPRELNSAFAEAFTTRGWEQPPKHSYYLTDDAAVLRSTLSLPAEAQKKEIENLGKVPVYSNEEIDFLNQRVAIEVQFGKYFSIAWDIFVRHLSYYNRELIDVGVEILPMKSMQSEMSSGPGYFEMAMGALARHGRGTPAMPLLVLGIAP